MALSDIITRMDGASIGGIGDQEKSSKVDGGQLPRSMRLKGS